MKRKISNLVLLCFLCLIFGCSGVSAAENKSDTLTITCQNDDIILSNMEWNIYRVADIIAQNQYSLSGNFKSYSVNLNNLTTSEMQTAASTLETYSKIDQIVPWQSGITDDDGVVVFDGLDMGLYLISGKSVTINDTFYMPSPSLVVIDNTEEDGVAWRYDVNAVPKLKVLPASMRIYDFSCLAKKVWTDDNDEIRPDSVTVLLMKDGVEIDSAVLNNENNWQHEWHYLSSEFEWSVIEKEVPENYTVTYSQIETNTKDEVEHDIEWTINNTYSVSETSQAVTTAQTQTETKVTTQPPSLPQTGQLWWPVPVLSAGGLIIFSTGWKINSHKRKKNEK